jgi:CheY-like chemotaxis protein
MVPDFTPAVSLTDLSILVVEDNSVSRQLIARLLNSLSYGNVTTTASGDEALEVMENSGRAPDLILCDWQMPGIDGLTLLTIVRGMWKDAVFVMVTATDSMEAAMMAKAHGADGYLLKPVNRANLQEAIEGAVRRARHIHP